MTELYLNELSDLFLALYAQESELCEREDPPADERHPGTCGLFGGLHQDLP